MSRIRPVNIKGDFDLGDITAIETIDTVTEVVNVTNVVKVQEVLKTPNEHLSFMQPTQIGNPVSVRIAAKSSLGNDWGMIINDNESALIPEIPVAGTQLAFSADFDGSPVNTTAQFIMKGYESSSSIVEKTEVLTLNGDTKVVIPGNWYRISALYLSPMTPSLPECTLYVYDISENPQGGAVTNYYEYVRVGAIPAFANVSERAQIYSPPNCVTAVNNIWLTLEREDQKNDVVQAEVCGRLRPSPAALFTYDRSFNIGRTEWQINNPQILIPPGGTLRFIGRVVNNADNSILSLNVEAARIQVI